MTTQPKQEEFEAIFELDVIAHAAGKCSFPLLALCSAEEQRVKSIVRSEKSKSYQQGREEMREEAVKMLEPIRAWPEPQPAGREGLGLFVGRRIGMYMQYDADKKKHEGQIGDLLSRLRQK